MTKGLFATFKTRFGQLEELKKKNWKLRKCSKLSVEEDVCFIWYQRSRSISDQLIRISEMLFTELKRLAVNLKMAHNSRNMCQETD